MIGIIAPEINTLMTNYVIHIAMFTIIIIAATYLKRQPEAPSGINMITNGFSALVLSNSTACLSLFTKKAYFYMIEISFACIASALFITASFMLKRKQFATNSFAYLLICIFVSFTAYAVYFNQAEYLLYLIYYFILGLGFIFLAVGFLGRPPQKARSGFNFSAIGLFLLAFFNFVMITRWGRDYISSLNLFILLHFIVALGFILAGNNLLSDKIQALTATNQESQARLRLIVQSSPFPIIISRLKDGSLMLVNRKASELLGINTDNTTDYKFSDFFNDPSSLEEINKKLEQDQKIGSMDFMLNKRLTSDEIWLQLSTHIIDFEYEIALYSSFQDITERKKKELKLFNEATRDPLTGAYTRRFFEEFAHQEITRAIRYNKAFCLAMIDADHFKNVNDTYGHAVGDKVLQALVSTTIDTLRESDVVCRFGGEEFLILLLEVDINTAQQVCDRLRAIISNLVITTDNNEEVRFTVSIGLVPSTYSTDYQTLLKAVDQALYIAKNSGRNRVVALTPQNTNQHTDFSTITTIENNSETETETEKGTETEAEPAEPIDPITYKNEVNDEDLPPLPPSDIPNQ